MKNIIKLPDKEYDRLVQMAKNPPNASRKMKKIAKAFKDKYKKEKYEQED
jgi:uncharacterized protein (DUF1778 family)